MKQLKPCAIGLLLVGVGVAGCGGGNISTSAAIPTLPTIPVTTADIAGTWTQVGGTRTWSVTQVGIQVGGPASFSQDKNPSFGAVSGTGYMVGAAMFGTLMFSEVYEHLTPSTPHADCYVNVDGQLTISSGSMTGSYTEVDECAGVRLGKITGTLTMQRK